VISAAVADRAFCSSTRPSGSRADRFARRQVVLAERNDGARLRALGALGILHDKTHFIAHGELFEPAIRDAAAVEIDLVSVGA
jgi:hypothetical protein